MKARSVFSAAGAALTALLLLVNCGSDKAPGTSNNGGALAAGSGSSAGGSGVSSGGGTSSGAPGVNAAGVSGGGGSNSAGAAPNSGGSTGNTIDASFKTFKGILEMSCFGSGCHSDAGNPLQMELDDKLYATLTSYTTRTCGKLLNTVSPAESALIRLLEGSCNGVSRMPYGVCVEDGDPSCVAPEYIAAIKAWIARGAPQ